MIDTPRKGDQQRLGILLAGGRSRRFGRDKALASLPDAVTMLERALDLLRPHVDTCLLVRSQDCPDLPPDVIQVVDPQQGPLRALQMALETAAACRAAHFWIAPCDMPLLHADLYQGLERRAWGRAGACYRGVHGLEPLVSVLTAEGARGLREWSDPSASLRRIFETLDCRLLEIATLAGPDVATDGTTFLNVNAAFLNVNTATDWQRARQVLRQDLVAPGRHEGGP